MLIYLKMCLFILKLYKFSDAYSLQNDDSNIFCSGDILHFVQMSRIFNSSNHFVNLKLVYPPHLVKQEFSDMLNASNGRPDNRNLRLFVNKNFESQSVGLKRWIPDDWVQRPKYIDNVYDINLKKWAQELNKIWKMLSFRMTDDVLKNDSLYSLTYVPRPYIAPGGRFPGIYYWDSYWIVEGLLISGMFSTAKNMLENLLYLVKKYGFVPNGSKVYYLDRSQVPLLIPMFDLYWNYQRDVTFLRESISVLEIEIDFWINQKSVSVSKDGQEYRVFHYHVSSTEPRPESYFEDINKSRNLNWSERLTFFSETRGAAESGWDFSSRWFIRNEGRTDNLIDIHTSDIAPVCLNSIMGYNSKLMSKFYSIIKNESKSEEYSLLSQEINKTISRLFWDDEEGMWFDYNIRTNELLRDFYPSNFLPLWSQMYGSERDPYYISTRILDYIYKSKVLSFEGGVPTSFRKSGQQWDFPNGWAPLQYFIVVGLRKLSMFNEEASCIAYELAEKWTVNCYSGFVNSTPHSMFEKYDVTTLGSPGEGGEYPNQVGFGWTNGVAIKFLHVYSHRIRLSHFFDPVPLVLFGFLMLVTAIVIFAYCRRLRNSKMNLQMPVKGEISTSCLIDENFF